MSKKITTIQISKETHKRLDDLRQKDQTYDTVICNLLSYYEVVILDKDLVKHED